MSQPITATAFDAETDLDDWRYLLGRIEAMFLAGSFEKAAELGRVIGEAAEAAGHHPDLDVRYPDKVHVALRTHAVDGVTQRDLALARTISALARDRGCSSTPTGTQALEVAIDAMDIPAVLPFWEAVLGYQRAGQNAIVDPLRIGPAFWFQQMDQPRPQRNRIHLDVTVPHDVADARIAAALAAGGTMVSDDRARAFWVLADPEGNEACVCTWQDRDP
jgi:4a-hydroxytetrahydrobiopterin dehydratase